MKKIRILLWTTALLPVLAIGAAAGFTVAVDPNDYKPEIAALVKAHTGRELELRGDLEFNFFPWLGVKTGPLALSNRAGFGPAPMLAVDRVVVRVKLLPLLRKHVEVGDLRLTRPHIRLARRADGAANWDDLAARVGHDGGRSHGGLPPDGALLAGLAVGGISITDGRVEWRDRAAGESLALSALHLDTGRLTPGRPLDVVLSLVAQGDGLPSPAALNLTTTALLAEDLESVVLGDTKLGMVMDNVTADLSVEKVSCALRTGRVALTGLRGGADRDGVHTTVEAPSLVFNRSDESLRLPRLDLRQGDFFLTASLTGAGLLSGLAARTAHGDVDARIADLKDLLARNGVAAWLPAGLANSVDVGLRFTLANRRLVLADLTVASPGHAGGELLLNQKELVIPIRADGTPDYGLAFVRLLEKQVKARFNRWLSGRIAQAGDAEDAGENAGKAGGFAKALREKLNQGLRRAPEGE